MRPNPRLIQLNKGEIRTVTSRFCNAIAAEAKEYLRKHPGEGDVPLALLEDRFYVNRIFEVENFRTKRGFDLHLRADEDEMPTKQIRDLQEGVEMHCPSDVMGGHLEVEDDVHRAYSQTIQMHLCPLLTVEGLTSVDIAYESAAFQDEVYSFLLHEMTHASEHGKPRNYKTVADKPHIPKEQKGTLKEYLNHPWEVRANARQIAYELVKAWRSGLRPTREKEDGRYRKVPGEVQELLDDNVPVTEILDLLLWDVKKYHKVWPHLTKANRKKLMQLLVRELQEEGLI